MIKEVNQFFNENQVLGIILIIMLLLAIYYISQIDTTSEHMDQTTPQILPKCTASDDQQFNMQYVNQSKILNFKCNVKGIDYYLTSVNMDDYIPNNPNKTPDCTQSMLILVPATEINTMLESYLKDMKTAEKICNSTLQIKCSADSQTDSAKAECSNEFPQCVHGRFFLHDFNIIDVTPPHADMTTTVRKYVIKGTAIPALSGKSKPTMFNTFLINEQGINMVCGDAHPYGVSSIPKQYAEVIITEKSANNTGCVVNADPMLTVKIRFNALQQIISKNNDGTTTRSPLIDTCTGETKIKPTYLGICDSTQTCTKGSNTYPRICVYDDIMHKNVLDFQPFLVNT